MKSLIKTMLMFALAMVGGSVWADVYQWDNGKGFVDAEGNPVAVDGDFTIVANFTMPSTVSSGNVICFNATKADNSSGGGVGIVEWSGNYVKYQLGNAKSGSGGHFSVARFSNTGNKENGTGTNVLTINATGFNAGAVSASKFKLEFAGASTSGTKEYNCNSGSDGENGPSNGTFGTSPIYFTSVTLAEGAVLVSATLECFTDKTVAENETFELDAATMRYKTITLEDGAKLVVNSSEADFVTLSAPILGSGAVELASGKVIFSGNNTFTNEFTVKSGAIAKAGSKAAFGRGGLAQTFEEAGVVNVESGATVDLNGFADLSYHYKLAGNGVDGQGALKNSRVHVISDYRQAVGITLIADAVINAETSFGMIPRGHNGFSTKISLNGYTLTKKGEADFYICNASLSGGEGDGVHGKILINEGKIYTTRYGSGTRQNHNPIKIEAGENGKLELNANITAVLLGSRPVYVKGTATLYGSSPDFTGGVIVENGGMFGVGGVGCFGPDQAETTKVTVLSGGTLDVKGIKNYTYAVDLAGKIVNSGDAFSYGDRGLWNLTLTGDGVIENGSNITLTAPGYDAQNIKLNGNTLLVKPSSDRIFYVNNVNCNTEGSVVVERGAMEFGLGGGSAMTWNNVDFKLAGGTIKLYKNLSISNLVYKSGSIVSPERLLLAEGAKVFIEPPVKTVTDGVATFTPSTVPAYVLAKKNAITIDARNFDVAKTDIPADGLPLIALADGASLSGVDIEVLPPTSLADRIVIRKSANSVKIYRKTFYIIVR